MQSNTAAWHFMVQSSSFEFFPDSFVGFFFFLLNLEIWTVSFSAEGEGVIRAGGGVIL